MLRLDGGTCLASEEYAYPNGGQTRPGMAVYPDGIVRRVWAGIPDTFWTIPAHGRFHGRYVSGFLTVDSSDGSDVHYQNERYLVFHIRSKDSDVPMAFDVTAAHPDCAYCRSGEAMAHHAESRKGR